MKIGLLVSVLACLVSVPGVAQQGDSDVLAQARVQLQGRNLDSSAALLRRITDSVAWADSGRRVNALVLLGMVRYYQGDGSASFAAFRDAVQIAPTLSVPSLAGLDSTLAALFDSARVTVLVAAAAARDTIYSCIPRCRGLDEEPRRVDGGGSLIPVEGNQTGLVGPRRSGSATFRVVLDTLGHVEPGSVEIVYSTLPEGLLRDVMRNFEGARYSPARVKRRAVRVRIEVRVGMN